MRAHSASLAAAPVIPEFRGSETFRTQGREENAVFLALGPGSRAAALGRDDMVGGWAGPTT